MKSQWRRESSKTKKKIKKHYSSKSNFWKYLCMLLMALAQSKYVFIFIFIYAYLFQPIAPWPGGITGSISSMFFKPLGVTSFTWVILSLGTLMTLVYFRLEIIVDEWLK